MRTSYFSVSTPLIKENFRRFGALPAVAFLIYFVGGIVPLMAIYKKQGMLASFINPLLCQDYYVYKILTLLLPVISASLVFRYLYGRSSATIMHALPLDKSRLWNSSFLSGLFFSVLPVIANGIVLLCLAKPTYFGKGVNFDNEVGGINEAAILSHSNVFSYRAVLSWIGISLLMIFCVYVISVFAAMLSGNGFIQFFVALGFNFLATAFMTMLTYYFEKFLFGYTTSDKMQELITTLSPFTGLTTQSKFQPDGALIAIYLITSLALMVVSATLYRYRRLERTQKAFVFRGMDTLLCWLLAFLGMTLTGLVLFSANTRWITYVSFAGGSVVAFIISRMVVKKTLHIFNLASLRSFAIYGAIAVVFLCILIFDLTGYEDRVPDPGQVSKVTIQDSTLFSRDSRFDASYYKGSGKSGQETYQTPENIELATQLHQSIISYYKNRKLAYEDGYMFSLHYKKNGMDLERNYLVSEDFFADSEPYKKIYESGEFKDLYRISNMKNLEKSQLSISSVFTSESINLNGKDRETFLTLLDQDFEDRTYKEETQYAKPRGYVSLTYRRHVAGRDYDMDGVTLNLLDSDTRCLSWLQKRGLIASLKPTAEDVEKIQIFACDPEKEDDALMDITMLNPEDSAYYKELSTIRDAKQIQTILDTCQETPGAFACKIFFKKNDAFSGESPYFYYSSDSVPDFLKALVN